MARETQPDAQVDSARSDRAPTLLGNASTAFLRRYPPFDTMEPEALAYMGPRLSLGYYPKGTAILAPEHGEPPFLFIVQRGLVHVAPPDAYQAAPGGVVPVRAGECFSLGALIEHRRVSAAYVAAADTFCYQLAREHVSAILERSPRFREYATNYLGTLLRESRRLLRMHHSSTAAEQQALGRSLRSLARRSLVVCEAGTPLSTALAAMQRHNVGSILVEDSAGTLIGIFTRHDLLDRVVLAGCDLAVPVERVMTRGPYVLSPDASAFDAALLIARHGVRHVPVVEEGRAIGIVTERDLFALQRASVRGAFRAVAEADTPGALVAAAAEIRGLARNLFEHGVGAEQLAHLVSSLNDALTARVLDVTAPRYDLDGVSWCWLAFGSEARYEQTIATDQDNGIVFADAAQTAPEKLRARLLPFAKAANETLDACGFPLCKGEIMAGNPSWCLSCSEWELRFAHWIENTDPQALLRAAIFFDLRGVHGQTGLASELRSSFLGMTQRNARFLRQLAEAALETRPPLGLLGGFIKHDTAESADTIDLKASGARLFVDVGRVMSLATGVTATNTAQRLRDAGTRLNMPRQEIASATEAFFFIQGLRLRGQLAAGEGAVPNRIDPDILNEVDRRLLKESLVQARNLQARLALDYGL